MKVCLALPKDRLNERRLKSERDPANRRGISISSCKAAEGEDRLWSSFPSQIEEEPERRVCCRWKRHTERNLGLYPYRELPS
jgi:hypothetical protein